MVEDGTLSIEDINSNAEKRVAFKRFTSSDSIVIIAASHRGLNVRKLQVALNYLSENSDNNLWDYFDSIGGSRKGFDIHQTIQAIQEIADRKGIVLNRSWDDPNWR